MNDYFPRARRIADEEPAIPRTYERFGPAQQLIARTGAPLFSGLLFEEFGVQQSLGFAELLGA
jgi:hypothetical protein